MFYKNSHKFPVLMSKIFHFPECIPKENSKAQSLCKSFKFMLNQGMLKPASPGVFVLMPLAIRALEKLCALVDKMMRAVDGQKVIFPTLTQDSLLKCSGRWHDNDNLFKLKDRHATEYCLGATHEEIATNILTRFPVSYKTLPLRFYQISPKFRDEMNPKLGLLRGREFIMKDMYTFDMCEESSENTYLQICNVYDHLFNLLGIEHIKVEGSCGDMGGKLSHEFQIISETGEDEVLFCPNCKTGINYELYSGNEIKCQTCDLSMERKPAIEIGHAFMLGTRYSKPFQANYHTPQHTPKLLEMGCYGLGLTRLLAACIESLSMADKIRWPLLISPYLLSIITPKKGSKEEMVREFADSLSQSLNGIDTFCDDIVIDDRINLTIGRRVEDAAELGLPYVVVIGKSALEDIPKIEVIDMYNEKTYFFTHRDTMDFFRKILIYSQ